MQRQHGLAAFAEPRVPRRPRAGSVRAGGCGGSGRGAGSGARDRATRWGCDGVLRHSPGRLQRLAHVLAELDRLRERHRDVDRAAAHVLALLTLLPAVDLPLDEPDREGSDDDQRERGGVLQALRAQETLQASQAMRRQALDKALQQNDRVQVHACHPNSRPPCGALKRDCRTASALSGVFPGCGAATYTPKR